MAKKIGQKDRLRINPAITFGGFSPIIITDARDQFYKLTTVGFNIHYDLIKYKAVSLVTTAGAFANYSRGILGTGGWHQEDVYHTEYFYSLYVGGNASLGLRIDPNNSKFAYEFRPITIYVGNNYFVLGYLMFGVDFKFKK